MSLGYSDSRKPAGRAFLVAGGPPEREATNHRKHEVLADSAENGRRFVYLMAPGEVCLYDHINGPALGNRGRDSGLS